MKIAQTINEARQLRQEHRAAGRSVALVPTMGFLHEGHLSLVRRAHELGEAVWVSIFANPTQFGPDEDFDRYPRDLDRDLSLLGQEGVHTVFVPQVDEMYPDPPIVQVGFSGLEHRLCGEDRPGHFAGVGLVVAKLFNIVEPRLAVFGQKDFQQAFLIRCMVRCLNFPVTIEVSPTVREADGLAMSSRNNLLSDEERTAAPTIYRALLAGQAAILIGERDSLRVREIMEAVLAEAPLLRPQYVDCVGANDLQSTKTINDNVVLAIAARAGDTRLIDNLAVVLVPSEE